MNLRLTFVPRIRAVTCMLGTGLLVGLGACLSIDSVQAATQVAAPRAGQVGAWRLLGQTEANFAADHDTIVVAGPNDNFRALKFKVTGASLDLRHMVVVYDNGQPVRIEVRQTIPQGGESRVIDFQGAGKRSIRRIDFWYDTRGILQGKADVTVFGRK